MTKPDDTNAAAGDVAAYRRLFLHSLLAFVIAFLASTLIHEGAHAVTARALGVPAVLHHNYVATDVGPNPSPAGRLWIPASGPLVSLALGVLCLVWVRTTRSASLTALCVLWLALKSHIGFFGYLMLGPVVTYGDTGRVYAELGTPSWLRWVIAVLGVAVLAWLVRSTGADFERHAPSAAPGEERSRGRVANALIAWPIVAGVALTTLLSLPVPTFASLMHPMTSPFIVFMAYGAFRSRQTPLPDGAHHPEHVSIPLVVVTVVLLVISRALVAGWPLG